MRLSASPQARWDLSHDPDARPLGCNGKYGTSGYQRHLRRGEEVCEKCRCSVNHYQRERKRGGAPTPLRLQPCGTPAAARRHRKAGEEPCMRCKLAEAQDAHDRYHARKAEAA